MSTAMRLLTAIAALWLLTGGTGASAQPQKQCQLDGMSVVAFGSYDTTGEAPLDIQGQLAYRCFNSAAAALSARAPRTTRPDPRNKLIVQITLSAGASGNFSRAMRGPSDSLLYNLYLDPQRTQIWGDGSGGTTVYTAHAQPNNKIETVPVFGRVFGGQDVAGGAYLDNLIVTLDF